MKIGILNGFVKDPQNETSCNYIHQNLANYGNRWQTDLSSYEQNGQQKYDVSNISVSEISNKYVLIINPFGEAYPENDIRSRNCFNITNEYITNGGIFAGFGGLQFFYGWDVNPGTTDGPQAISAKHLFIQTQWDNQGVVGRKVLEFSGTLMWNYIPSGEGYLIHGGIHVNSEAGFE